MELTLVDRCAFVRKQIPGASRSRNFIVLDVTNQILVEGLVHTISPGATYSSSNRLHYRVTSVQLCGRWHDFANDMMKCHRLPALRLPVRVACDRRQVTSRRLCDDLVFVPQSARLRGLAVCIPNPATRARSQQGRRVQGGRASLPPCISPPNHSLSRCNPSHPHEQQPTPHRKAMPFNSRGLSNAKPTESDHHTRTHRAAVQLPTQHNPWRSVCQHASPPPVPLSLSAVHCQRDAQASSSRLCVHCRHHPADTHNLRWLTDVVPLRSSGKVHRVRRIRQRHDMDGHAPQRALL